MLQLPPISTLFPYTTLFRSNQGYATTEYLAAALLDQAWYQISAAADRKSTRLNSSHVEISYAVFCLKKKKIKILQIAALYHDLGRILDGIDIETDTDESELK